MRGRIKATKPFLSLEISGQRGYCYTVSCFLFVYLLSCSRQSTQTQICRLRGMNHHWQMICFFVILCMPANSRQTSGQCIWAFSEEAFYKPDMPDRMFHIITGLDGTCPSRKESMDDIWNREAHLKTTLGSSHVKQKSYSNQANRITLPPVKPAGNGAMLPDNRLLHSLWQPYVIFLS